MYNVSEIVAGKGGRIIAAKARSNGDILDITKLGDSELIEAYGDILQELKNRKIIRSKNVTGDLGEYLAVECYHRNKDFPNISLVKKSTQHYDAYGLKGGKNYSIKTTTGNSTGVIRTPATPEHPEEPKALFDCLVVVQLDQSYRLKAVYEIDWDVFVEERKWHKTMNAWNIVLTKSVLSKAKQVYPIEVPNVRTLSDFSQ